MTAAELYETSSDFRSLIAEWVQVKRCPYGMGDFLDEHDLPGPARAARWAATEPDRPAYTSHLETCGVFPAYDPAKNKKYQPYWWWFDMSLNAVSEHPDCYNDVPFRVPDSHTYNPTTESALLCMLDNKYWKRRPT